MEFPQCTLRIARFKGTSRTEFIDNRQVHGNAFKLLSSAEAFVRENNPIAGRMVPDRMERVDEPLYPPLAVREALVNALCHREYAIAGGSVAVGIQANAANSWSRAGSYGWQRHKYNNPYFD